MDVNAITQLVSNVGFPIVACGALAWLFYREQSAHKEESKNFTDAINNLTIVLTQLSDAIRGGESND